MLSAPRAGSGSPTAQANPTPFPKAREQLPSGRQVLTDQFSSFAGHCVLHDATRRIALPSSIPADTRIVLFQQAADLSIIRPSHRISTTAQPPNANILPSPPHCTPPATDSPRREIPDSASPTPKSAPSTCSTLTPMSISHTHLSPVAPRSVEESVTRDGTNHSSVERRIETVLRQLDAGRVELYFESGRATRATSSRSTRTCLRTVARDSGGRAEPQVYRKRSFVGQVCTLRFTAADLRRGCGIGCESFRELANYLPGGKGGMGGKSGAGPVV